MGVIIDFDYEINTDTDKQGGSGYAPLPYMNARVWAEAISFPPTKDGKGRQAEIHFEVQEPEEFKGRKWREWWTMLHPDGNKDKAYSFGKGRFDKFCRAVRVVVERGANSDDLLFQSFVVRIGQNEFNGKINNQIEHFFYEDDGAKEELPELGVIGDGTAPTRSAPKAAANDNRTAASNDNKPASAAPAKKAPWGAKK